MCDNSNKTENRLLTGSALITCNVAPVHVKD